MRLQTAVDALGDDNSPEATMLRDALKKAQQDATKVPVGVRFDACAQFVERARNRLVEYTFIQKRFHPLTLSSKHDFIQ